MARKVKCSICQKEMEITQAYCAKVLVKTRTPTPEPKYKNVYCCSEEEYNLAMLKIEQTNILKRRINSSINRIIGYENRNTLLFNAEKEWIKNPTYVDAIENHESYISEALNKKGFDRFANEYNLIKYLSAVINNNLNKWCEEIYSAQRVFEIKERKSINYVEYETKSYQKRKRKCLNDYE